MRTHRDHGLHRGLRGATVALFVLGTLLATVVPAQAFGGPHQGEAFYLCYYDQRTRIGGDRMETWKPCKASADDSNYWVPVLYRDGSAVRPNKMHIYLRNAVKATPEVFPNGLKWVAGDPNATSQQTGWAKRYFWQCGDTAASTHYATPPNCANATNGQGETALTLIVRFPQCWNGSRWSYPKNGDCPSDTTLTIQLQVHVQYMVDDAARSKMRLSTGSIYGVHAGFKEGWDRTVLQSYIDDCIEPGDTCHIDS
jgi:uncharacterized protein DUF1996